MHWTTDPDQNFEFVIAEKSLLLSQWDIFSQVNFHSYLNQSGINYKIYHLSMNMLQTQFAEIDDNISTLIEDAKFYKNFQVYVQKHRQECLDRFQGWQAFTDTLT